MLYFFNPPPSKKNAEYATVSHVYSYIIIILQYPTLTLIIAICISFQIEIGTLPN